MNKQIKKHEENTVILKQKYDSVLAEKAKLKEEWKIEKETMKLKKEENTKKDLLNDKYDDIPDVEFDEDDKSTHDKEDMHEGEGNDDNEENEREKERKRKKKTVKCRYMENKWCRKSSDECEYMHTVCSELFDNKYCKYGMNCRYVHTPNMRKNDIRSSVPCKFYRQGWCYKGEKCEYSHKLIESAAQNTQTLTRPKQRPSHQNQRYSNPETQQLRQNYSDPRYQQRAQPMRRNYTHHQNFQINHWRERYVRDEDLIENLVRRLLRNLKKEEEKILQFQNCICQL